MMQPGNRKIFLSSLFTLKKDKSGLSKGPTDFISIYIIRIKF
jgi:hypothetical protein